MGAAEFLGLVSRDGAVSSGLLTRAWSGWRHVITIAVLGAVSLGLVWQ